MPVLPSLRGSDLLDDPGVRAVFGILGPGARIVGGAVRNLLLGEPAGDVDFGTPRRPDDVVRAAGAAGLRAIPTGIDHGTVTLLWGGRTFEVTTLRADVETDGRHAVVRFGADWDEDARRRDFTLNALSLDAAGTVYDPVGGYPDLLARRVRFIGDPDARIAEDRLRALRFFRFHARYARGSVDPEGLAAARRARNTLPLLSAERVGAELRKMVVAPGAVPTVGVMAEAGILEIVLGGAADVPGFARLAAFLADAGGELRPALALAVLAGAHRPGDVVALADRLRWSGAERDAVLAGLRAADTLTASPDARGLRALAHRHGIEALRDGLALAAARPSGPGDSPPVDWVAPWRSAADSRPPRFPLSGRDVLATGIRPGPQIGALLADLENWWIDQDFRPDAETLRRRLQAFAAAQQ